MNVMTEMLILCRGYKCTIVHVLVMQEDISTLSLTPVHKSKQDVPHHPPWVHYTHEPSLFPTSHFMYFPVSHPKLSTVDSPLENISCFSDGCLFNFGKGWFHTCQLYLVFPVAGGGGNIWKPDKEYYRWLKQFSKYKVSHFPANTEHGSSGSHPVIIIIIIIV